MTTDTDLVVLDMLDAAELAEVCDYVRDRPPATPRPLRDPTTASDDDG
jgi:hypothetical protein